MNEVLQAIAQRSSTRKYKTQIPTKEQIDKLLTAALQAPTGKNQQEIHITVVNADSPLLKEIEDAKRSIILKDADEKTKEYVQSNTNNFYYDAPLLFILSADRDFRWSSVDAGICVQNIALAAQSLGLGSLIIGSIYDALHGDKKAYFAQKLKFPENYEFEIAIAVGSRDTEKEPHSYSMEKNVTIL